MNAVEATVQNRRIEVPAPDDWPDGTKVMVDVTPVPAGNRLDDVDFMTEDEQSDDPDAIERWALACDFEDLKPLFVLDAARLAQLPSYGSLFEVLWTSTAQASRADLARAS